MRILQIGERLGVIRTLRHNPILGSTKLSPVNIDGGSSLSCSVLNC